MITKQKRNLIHELSFWTLQEVETINDNNFVTPMYKKTNIRTLIHIIKSSKEYSNKQIKELINELKYQLPF